MAECAHEAFLHRALSHDERWADYSRRMRTWHVAYDRWLADGGLGPAPPQPARPSEVPPKRDSRDGEA